MIRNSGYFDYKENYITGQSGVSVPYEVRFEHWSPNGTTPLYDSTPKSSTIGDKPQILFAATNTGKPHQTVSLDTFACGSPTSDVGERMDVELQRWAWSRVDAAARRKDRHMVDTAARSKDRCERGGCCIKEEGQVQGGCCSKEEGQAQGGCCSKEKGQVQGGCCSREEGLARSWWMLEQGGRAGAGWMLQQGERSGAGWMLQQGGRTGARWMLQQGGRTGAIMVNAAARRKGRRERGGCCIKEEGQARARWMLQQGGRAGASEVDAASRRKAWCRVDAAARRKDRREVDAAAGRKDWLDHGGCWSKEEGQARARWMLQQGGRTGAIMIHARNPNEIIFGLNDGYYGASFESKDSTESRRNSHLQVEQNAVRNSYGVFSLLRLHRAQCAIKQTQVTVQKIGKEIEEKLRISSSNNNLKKESECLRLKILVLQDELKRQKRALGREVELLHKERSAMTAKRNKFTSQREKLQKKSESLNELRKECTAKRESFLKTNAQLTIRCRQLISELSYIYPIDAVSNQSRTLSTPRIQRLHTVKAESLDTLEIAPEKKFSMQSLCVF
ncbi:unnamed protein product [Ranitomeya imitator]|uniref:Uncharacterized protein n=1 Tax=Ranitomeya imitator TaxID=111125 RepID=A0ABN9MFA5_9NEOB|nr:unnamed protein product [Ranitomeya imitator]